MSAFGFSMLMLVMGFAFLIWIIKHDNSTPLSENKTSTTEHHSNNK